MVPVILHGNNTAAEHIVVHRGTSRYLILPPDVAPIFLIMAHTDIRQAIMVPQGMLVLQAVPTTFVRIINVQTRDSIAEVILVRNGDGAVEVDLRH